MRLGELLLASGLLSADQLEAALQGQRSSGMKLGEYLIKQGICRESDVVDAVCRQTGIERYTPSRFPLNLSLSDRLPADVAQRTNAVPLLIRGDVLVVAMMDPLDIDALDRIEIVTDREVEPDVPPAGVHPALRRAVRPFQHDGRGDGELYRSARSARGVRRPAHRQ